MSDSTIITIVAAVLGAIPPTLVAWAALKKGEQVEKKTEVIEKKTDVIHTLADGNLSKVTAALEIANTKIQGLETLVASIAAKSTTKPNE